MTEEIIIDKEEFWDAFEQHPINAVDGLFSKIEAIVNLIKRLEQELKWANDEEKYLKDCCIKAGKELEKHSFKWDGKEKNLVVQALQLNQLYEKLEQENKELKEMYRLSCLK